MTSVTSAKAARLAPLAVGGGPSVGHSLLSPLSGALPISPHFSAHTAAVSSAAPETQSKEETDLVARAEMRFRELGTARLTGLLGDMAERLGDITLKTTAAEFRTTKWRIKALHSGDSEFRDPNAATFPSFSRSMTEASNYIQEVELRDDETLLQQVESAVEGVASRMIPSDDMPLVLLPVLTPGTAVPAAVKSGLLRLQTRLPEDDKTYDVVVAIEGVRLSGCNVGLLLDFINNAPAERILSVIYRPLHIATQLAVKGAVVRGLSAAPTLHAYGLTAIREHEGLVSDMAGHLQKLDRNERNWSAAYFVLNSAARQLERYKTGPTAPLPSASSRKLGDVFTDKPADALEGGWSVGKPRVVHPFEDIQECAVRDSLFWDDDDVRNTTGVTGKGEATPFRVTFLTRAGPERRYFLAPTLEAARMWTIALASHTAGGLGASPATRSMLRTASFFARKKILRDDIVEWVLDKTSLIVRKAWSTKVAETFAKFEAIKAEQRAKETPPSAKSTPNPTPIPTPVPTPQSTPAASRSATPPPPEVEAESKKPLRDIPLAPVSTPLDEAELTDYLDIVSDHLRHRCAVHTEDILADRTTRLGDLVLKTTAGDFKATRWRLEALFPGDDDFKDPPLHIFPSLSKCLQDSEKFINSLTFVNEATFDNRVRDLLPVVARRIVPEGAHPLILVPEVNRDARAPPAVSSGLIRVKGLLSASQEPSQDVLCGIDGMDITAGNVEMVLAFLNGCEPDRVITLVFRPRHVAMQLALDAHATKITRHVSMLSLDAAGITSWHESAKSITLVAGHLLKLSLTGETASTRVGSWAKAFFVLRAKRKALERFKTGPAGAQKSATANKFGDDVSSGSTITRTEEEAIDREFPSASARAVFDLSSIHSIVLSGSPLWDEEDRAVAATAPFDGTSVPFRISINSDKGLRRRYFIAATPEGARLWSTALASLLPAHADTDSQARFTRRAPLPPATVVHKRNEMVVYVVDNRARKVRDLWAAILRSVLRRFEALRMPRVDHATQLDAIGDDSTSTDQQQRRVSRSWRRVVIDPSNRIPKRENLFDVVCQVTPEAIAKDMDEWAAARERELLEHLREQQATLEGLESAANFMQQALEQAATGLETVQEDEDALLPAPAATSTAAATSPRGVVYEKLAVFVHPISQKLPNMLISPHGRIPATPGSSSGSPGLPLSSTRSSREAPPSLGIGLAETADGRVMVAFTTAAYRQRTARAMATATHATSRVKPQNKLGLASISFMRPAPTPRTAAVAAVSSFAMSGNDGLPVYQIPPPPPSTKHGSHHHTAATATPSAIPIPPTSVRHGAVIRAAGGKSSVVVEAPVVPLPVESLPVVDEAGRVVSSSDGHPSLLSTRGRRIAGKTPKSAGGSFFFPDGSNHHNSNSNNNNASPTSPRDITVSPRVGTDELLTFASKLKGPAHFTFDGSDADVQALAEVSAAILTAEERLVVMLEPGDIILSINGLSVAGKALDFVATKLASRASKNGAWIHVSRAIGRLPDTVESQVTV